MNILYRVSYIPHLESGTPPFYYDGSKFKYTIQYMGSPSSTQADWYTDGISIREWWKRETKNNPNNFKFEIIEDCGEITPQELVKREKEWHISNDVKRSDLFFNKSIATEGWVSIPRTEVTKEKVAGITKAYWDDMTPEKELRKEVLREYNRKNSSEKFKKTWREKPEAFANRKYKPGKKVMGDGVLYESAKAAAEILDLTQAAISYRTISPYTKDRWYYINEGEDV